MRQHPEFAPRRIRGRRWLVAAGRTLPVISGADETVPEPDPVAEDAVRESPVPRDADGNVNFAEFDGDLAELQASLDAEFDQLLEDGDATADDFEAVAQDIEAVRGEVARIEAEEAEEAERIAAIRARVRPEASDEDPEADPEVEPAAEPDEQPAPAPAPAPDPDARVPVTAAGRPVARRRGASPAGVARRSPASPPAPRHEEPRISITAAADVPGIGLGSEMSLTDVARGFAARAHNMADGGSAHVATITVPADPETVIADGSSVDDVLRQLEALCDPRRLEPTLATPANALVAAGGWCAPPETRFDFLGLEGTSGLLDLPTIQMSRGSLQVPDYIGLSAATGALWTWTEAQDIAAYASGQVTNKALTTNVATLTTDAAHGITVGDQVTVSGVDATFDGTYTTTAVTSTTFSYAKTAANVASVAVSPVGRWQDLTAEQTKPCLRIPCPGFTEYTLEAEGVCVTHGNLSSRAWPELQNRFVSLVMIAHLHRMSAAKIAKIAADAADVTVPDGGSDIVGNVVDALAMQAADIRSQHRMDVNAVVEAVLPQWWMEAMRAVLAKRSGVDMIDVPMSRIQGLFTQLRIRPQFVYALDPLWTGSNRTAWPTTSKALLYPAGTYFEGTGGTIDLGVQRDSVLNATNDFTAAWSETFYTVGRRGPAGREVTVTTPMDGKTGGDNT
jgi:hypothetical protein